MPKLNRTNSLTIDFRFIVTNPGRQLLTGSFQPVDDEEWENEAYVTAGEILDYVDALSEVLRGVTLFQQAAASAGHY